MIDKPFPMPGTVWQCAGGGGFPPSGPHVVTGLRWFRNRVEAMFDDGQSCAGVEWMMTLDMWQCVSAVDPMPLDVLTPEEQDIVIAAIPLQAGITRDGERVIAAANTAREEAEAKLRALGQSSDMAAALVRNARAVLSQGHTIGLTAESAPKLHAVLSAYVGAK